MTLAITHRHDGLRNMSFCLNGGGGGGGGGGCVSKVEIKLFENILGLILHSRLRVFLASKSQVNFVVNTGMLQSLT